MADEPDDLDSPVGYASPPCFMHEIDPGYAGLTVTDEQARRDVARWRKAERERLIALRLAFSVETRRGFDARIGAALDAALGDVRGKTVATYWPFRGEPDLRGWMERVIARGGACALPVVVKKAAPLIFRPWRPGAAMERGVWNIPIPSEGPEIAPDIVISPVVGFDRERYRLGYGGGYYDRTMAAAPEGTRLIGVGYAAQAIATIYPQSYDIPMDEILTEDGPVG
ncbi:5-formyltetrahydrofolate cyclo-ligase [Pikeienuella sp. HZG-20]|uniref:5-formyltetrahydrofolate cyclo-ligase n=1 Tax=Paludibacillus litoralis TaxID=3133267 RepID=UPI0030EC65D7